MERHMFSSRTSAGLGPSTAAALTIGLCLGLGLSASAEADPGRPNIVLIVTDDEDVASHASMPKTKALIEDQGTIFANFFISYPFCCPSRASILRGQYAHNTRIVGNEQPLGGFEKFREQGLEASTVATWLQDAGYRTAMIGKYLNRYVPQRHDVPPGWDDWYVGGNAHASYNYVLNENGRIVTYGDTPKDYLNDVLTDKTIGIIKSSAAAGQAFFAYVLPYTLHSPSVAAPRHEGMFADAELPRPPAFDEADVSDKPALIRNLPRIDPSSLAYLEDQHRKRIRSLQAIDDMVERIVGALREAGQLESTYVIYTSDNGFHLGQHRLPVGKDTPYEEDLRVPMVMRGPDVPAGERIEAMVVNIDLAPALADIASVEPPAFVDGRSFLPLIEDPHRTWRESFLIERRQLEGQLVALAERSGMTEREIKSSAIFDGIRTKDLVYVEYGTGERELYDLGHDPHQLTNVVHKADPDLVKALAARLQELKDCAGADCRSLEDAPILEEQPRQLADQRQ
jgi:N-acetylglucosamine-6-sulfatase